MTPLDLILWALAWLIVVAVAVFTIAFIAALVRSLTARRPKTDSRDVFKSGDDR